MQVMDAALVTSLPSLSWRRHAHPGGPRSGETGLVGSLVRLGSALAVIAGFVLFMDETARQVDVRDGPNEGLRSGGEV